MYLPYFQNYIGVELTEEEYQNINHPYAEMYTHVTLKTIQAGTLLGTILFGPLVALARKESRNVRGLVSKVNRCGRAGAVIGLVAGPVMTYKKFLDQTEEAVFDRAYRVRKNRNQIRVDRAYIVGTVVGSTLGTLTMVNPLFGELAGSSIGLLGTTYYNNMYLPSMKTSADEKKEQTINTATDNK